MSIGKGKSNKISITQAKCIRLIKDRLAAGEDMSRELLIQCHDTAYDLKGDRKLASTYAGQNMKRVGFLAGLSLDHAESQHTLKDVLWSWLLDAEGSERKAITAAKLLAAASLGQKQTITFDEGEFAGRTTAELEHYAKFGDWPKTIKGTIQ